MGSKGERFRIAGTAAGKGVTVSHAFDWRGGGARAGPRRKRHVVNSERFFHRWMNRWIHGRMIEQR